MYGRELAMIKKGKNKKEYRVMKKQKSKLMGKMRKSRSIKMVDKRMKADKRGLKIALRRGRKKHKPRRHKRR